MATPERVNEPFLDAVAVLRRWGFTQDTEPFLGRWKGRQPWGIPGPLYVAEDDACGTGPEAAPNNVYLHDAQGEFIFRQASTEYELRQLVDAAELNVVSQYAFDGNEYWTPSLVASWWGAIQPGYQQLRETVAEYDKALRRLGGRSRSELDAEWQQQQRHVPTVATRRWLDYLEHGAEEYLLRYIAFLETGRVPALDDRD
ncbi:hypothetical protein [Pyxidicoccus xibeiensis]|uniref:hypothetical protein n=1 Tax=Pyxidicoccus xibeiensis TaxID=2906759 RepID=UPI0020A71B03|nr:hypothetical protein [Pyxidicoccus xibeiensis]MCP3137916.1 hypothetical protein [Pyxidicoccus xibeiensis]